MYESKVIPFLSMSPIDHKVGDKIMQFWPVSVEAAFKLKDTFKPLAKAVTTLFQSNGSDTGSVQRSLPDENGGTLTEIIVEALTPAMAETRLNQRMAAIDELIEAFTSEKNSEMVGSLILDSIYRGIEEWQNDRKLCPPAKTFVKELPLSLYGLLLMGVAMANKDTFGPLASLVGDSMAKLKETAERRVANAMGSQNEGEAASNPETTA